MPSKLFIPADKVRQLLTETIGVQDELDRLHLRMESRGDTAAEFTKAVRRIHGEVRQLVVRIRDLRPDLQTGGAGD